MKHDPKPTCDDYGDAYPDRDFQQSQVISTRRASKHVGNPDKDCHYINEPPRLIDAGGATDGPSLWDSPERFCQPLLRTGIISSIQYDPRLDGAIYSGR